MWGAIFEAFSCFSYYFLSLASMHLSPSISTLKMKGGFYVQEIQKESSIKPERITKWESLSIPRWSFQRIFPSKDCNFIFHNYLQCSHIETRSALVTIIRHSNNIVRSRSSWDREGLIYADLIFRKETVN